MYFSPNYLLNYSLPTTPEVLDALPLLAVWGLWGPWSACSKKKYCQEGQQHRRRICVTLEDSAHCVGVSMEARDCPAASCVHACKQSLRNLKELSTVTNFIRI